MVRFSTALYDWCHKQNNRQEKNGSYMGKMQTGLLSNEIKFNQWLSKDPCKFKKSLCCCADQTGLTHKNMHILNRQVHVLY